jgi:hypothetical protein
MDLFFTIIALLLLRIMTEFFAVQSEALSDATDGCKAQMYCSLLVIGLLKRCKCDREIFLDSVSDQRIAFSINTTGSSRSTFIEEDRVSVLVVFKYAFHRVDRNRKKISKLLLCGRSFLVSFEYAQMKIWIIKKWHDFSP